MNLLPMIHKRLYDVPGRPAISNCGKASELLDEQLKEVKTNGWSYVKDSNNFIKKMKHLRNIPDNSLLVTADVVGSSILYPSIPRKAGLRALKRSTGQKGREKDLY